MHFFRLRGARGFFSFSSGMGDSKDHQPTASHAAKQGKILTFSPSSCDMTWHRFCPSQPFRAKKPPFSGILKAPLTGLLKDLTMERGDL
jgi:hypothetical protein